MGRVCRQKGRRDPLLAAWQAGSPEPWPKILPRASKEEWPARENHLNESLLVFSQRDCEDLSNLAFFLTAFSSSAACSPANFQSCFSTASVSPGNSRCA